MASFGGFLQGLGLAYGNSLIYGQQFEQNKARTELLKTEAERAQMQTRQMQQQMQTQQKLGAFIQSQTELEGANATNPLEQAKMYSKAAGIAASMGDFASSQEMSKLSENASTEARQQAVDLAQQKAAKNEDLANAADAYASNPTREGAMELARKAIAAGQNPASIPANLNSTEGQAWVSQQRLAGMASGKRAEFLEKISDAKARRDEQWQIHKDNVALRQATMQQTAAFREESLALRRSEIADRQAREPKVVSIGSGQYEFDPTGNMKGERLASDPRYVKLGEKTTAQQESNAKAIGGAAAEATRNLDQMSRFPTGIVNSPFAHMTDHTFTSALGKTATNVITPEQVQMFQTSSSGLATELSRVMTLGGGRGANQSVINEVKQQITPTAGDTNLEAAYKLSTGAQIVLTRMQSQSPPQDQQAAKKWNETMATLEKYPTPEQILNVASGKERQKLSTLEGSYNNLLNKIGGEGLPGGANTGAGTNVPPLPAGGGLPSGWSVKVH